MGAFVDRAERLWSRLLDGIALAMMATLVVVIGYSVFARQVLRISVPWSEEVGAGLLLWMVSLGAAAAWYRRGHIAIDVLLKRMSVRIRFGALIAIELASLLLFVLIFAGSFSMMFVSANNATTALGISYSYLYLALVVGVGSMILFSIAHLVRLIRAGGPLDDGREGGEWSTLSSS
ncbi:TRAP transporter small permease [Fodinicurvata sp. EGI_FJ10296]|uniref:TRAP transporter small permease n=1 Tax=Fodinicurvata sp. EGI_FJ10296 TaxID=3231908 RepID=UPI003456BD1C